jgi:hypothetical protein
MANSLAPEKNEKIKLIPFAGGASQDLIVELINRGDRYSFCVYDKLNNKLEINDFYIGPENEHYVPIEKPPWLVPNAIQDLNVDENSLYNELLEYLIEHLDLLDEMQYHILACFILASWRWEEFKTAPYLFFLGPPSSGKTRALECLHLLCYRAIHAASITAPAMFRAIEAWHPTLLLDETEIYEGESAAEIRAVINAGYKQDAKVIRIEKVNEQPVLASFNVFSFKALAGTKELSNTIMSRCIVINMERNVRSVKMFLNMEKAAELRQKLLKYRMKYLNLAESAVANNGFIFEDGRLAEMFHPLITVAPAEIKEKLVEYAKKVYQTRLEEEKASLEAMVLEAILKAKTNNENEEKIEISYITDLVNLNLPVKEQLKNCQVGRIAASLGFKRTRGKEGKRAIIWDNKLVARLLRRYLPEKLEKLDSFDSLTVLTVNSIRKGVESEDFKQKNVNNSFFNKENLMQTNRENDEKHPFHTELTVKTVNLSIPLEKQSLQVEKKQKFEIYPLHEGEKAVCMYCNQPAKFRIVGEEPWQVEYLCPKHKLEIEKEVEKCGLG